MTVLIDEEKQALADFLDASPTAWHAVSQASEKLKNNGFQELKEEASWNIQPGKKYFVVRNGSSLCAFITPSKEIKSARIVASHTDSPGLKLKPNAEFRKENMIMLGVEVYGGPLLTSWLNRDLGIGGRIYYLDSSDKVCSSTLRLDDHPVTIPQLAIHLDRQVNENGLILNKQDHLSALAALASDKDDKKNYLETLIREKLDYSSLLGHDFFLYPLEKARFLGYNQELIASYRIDSLASVHSALTALCSSMEPLENQLKMAIFWDNEEVGSSTSQGAGSPFFPQILERISLARKMSREDYLRIGSQSICISVDLGHALHPNYSEKHDPRHQPLLGQGILLKSNAQQRYITDAESGAFIARLCRKNDIPLQKFVSRSDISCGTTIGPIHASLTGMKTVDIGCAQLSMHSIRELMACQDVIDMTRLLTAALNDE